VAIAGVLAIAVGGCVPQSTSGRARASMAWVDDVSLSARPATGAPRVAPATPIVQTYRDVARRIIDAARADSGAWDKLRHLTDRIGHRLSGSKAMEAAVAWSADAMRADGHDVRVEDVMVPHWVRGIEEGEIVAPDRRPLRLLGLGGTVSTPKGGLTAPVVVVRSFKELAARSDADVKGKIVLYDVAMPAWNETTGSGYGEVVRYRWAGAIEAAKRGAVGVLMRSITASSLRTPHTGSMGYDDKTPKIPAAAISVEDSKLIARLADAGVAVSVRLRLESKQLPDARSGNVIGELRGRELPDEIVLIGAHLDSWDVGQGAHDDGAGCVVMMQALTVLRRLGLTPRRTIRVVLFTNEENGLRGAKAYAKDHAGEIAKHVAAFESDSGGFAPIGFRVEASDAGARSRISSRFGELTALLAPVGATRVADGHAGADVDPLVKGGVPGFGLWVDGRRYFDYHHTEADTLDKVDPAELAANVAVMAVMAYVVADLKTRLDIPADDPAFDVRMPTDEPDDPAFERRK
jgi:carboxypeptidase Q